VAGTGAFAANPPAANAGVSHGAGNEKVADAPVDPDWAEIGDAAVLYRDPPG
jgi:hypothetical protein